MVRLEEEEFPELKKLIPGYKEQLKIQELPYYKSLYTDAIKRIEKMK